MRHSFFLDNPHFGKVFYNKAPRLLLHTTPPTYYTHPAQAIILHPSTACPLVIAPEAPFSLFLLLNEELVDNYYLAEPSSFFLNRLHYHLRHITWSEKVRLGAKAKQQGQHLYPPTPEVYQHLSTSRPEPITASRTPLILPSDQIMGYAAASQMAFYLEAGYTHLICLTFDHNPLPTGFHNLHWHSFAYYEGTQLEKSVFEEPQDALLHQQLQAQGMASACTYQVHSLHTGFVADLTNPIACYHPIYVTDAPKLTFAHMTDLHLSSRHFAFEQVKAKVFPNLSDTLSPPLGTCVLNTLDAVLDLMDQIGGNTDIHCLVITGDLVDYGVNLSPEHIPLKNTADLWQKMHLKRHFKRGKMHHFYETGVDHILMLSLLVYYYDIYQKPIFMTEGNHDHYKYPYGISPRVSSMVPFFESLLVNGCIPRDHNLSFYEALLLFGPGYRDILAVSNFSAPIHDIFLALFCPLTDFSWIYKQQTITGLGWGNQESLLSHYIDNPESGTLPRAVDLISDHQWPLLAAETPHHLLFMHAPVVNYEASVPLQNGGNEKRAIDCSDNPVVSSSGSRYDEGSFFYHRNRFYQDYLIKNTFSHVFSGHAHRSALYGLTCLESHPLGETGVRQFIHKTGVLTEAFPLIGRHYPEYLLQHRTRLVVTGSGGPMAVRNLEGELGGMNACPPSATLLTWLPEEKLTVIYPRIPQAAPRLAAVLDYAEKETALSFQFSPGSPEILLLSIPATWTCSVPLFENIQLVFTNQAICEILPSRCVVYSEITESYQLRGHFSVAFGQIGRDRLLFAVFYFNEQLRDNRHFKQHSIKHPWIMPLEVHQDPLSGALSLKRPHKERPYEAWYKTHYPQEFSV
jgi:hypothetical protein